MQGIQKRGDGHFVTREYPSIQTVYYDPAWYYDEQYIFQSVYSSSTKCHSGKPSLVTRACSPQQSLAAPFVPRSHIMPP